ncbi:MAG: helix-turn-helix domain-containing protein [Bacillota bacterium]|jgi:excisionase family DNA binding protein
MQDDKILMNDYLTLKEMAELSQTAYATVKRNIDNGKLPAYHIGRKYFIKKKDAQVYLENQEKTHNIDGYTVKELMQIIPLSYAFIIELIRSKKLEAVKVGRQYIVPKTSFEDFLENNKIGD